MEFETQFKELGLSARETDIYIALLKSGPTSGYHLSKVTKHVISTVYFILDELQKKGLVSKIQEGKKQRFAAKDPRKILEEQRTQLNSFEAIMPSLLAYTHEREKPTIGFYEGLEEKQTAWDAFMKKANQDEVVAFFTYFPEGITKKRLDHAMATNDDVAKFKKVRAITPDFQPTDDNPGSVVPLYPYIKKFGWEVRVLPLEKYSPILTTHISGNMIRLSSRQPDQTILIEDKNIADSQRQLFELVWEAAGEETELRPEEIQ